MLNFAGPFLVRIGKNIKIHCVRWFTSFVFRHVQLEVRSNLSTKASFRQLPLPGSPSTATKKHLRKIRKTSYQLLSNRKMIVQSTMSAPFREAFKRPKQITKPCFPLIWDFRRSMVKALQTIPAKTEEI